MLFSAATALCETRAIQVVETVSQSHATAVVSFEEDSLYEGYHVFFQDGVSKILLWKPNCSVILLRTGKNLDDLKEKDPFNEDDDAEAEIMLQK